MKLSDRIEAPSRGNAGVLIERARRAGTERIGFVTEYATALEELCEEYGFDFAFAAGQADNESDSFTSDVFYEYGNTVGLGVTNSQNLSLVYKTGREMALAHIIHLWAYVRGRIPPGHPLEKHIPLDPRYAAVFGARDAVQGLPMANSVTTVGDFNVNGRWALLPDDGSDRYGQRILDRMVAIFGNVPQTPVEAGGLVFGLVEDIDWIDMTVHKQFPGQGYDVCPPRHNVGVVPHETQGDPLGEGVVELEWYRAFFSCPNGERCSNALVDWCAARDGTWARFNDPNGTREPWASGGAANFSNPVGAAWNNHFGSGKRNEIMESVEFIKTDNARLTAAQIQTGARRAAFVADQDGQPWHEYPNPSKHAGVHMMPQHGQLSFTTCGHHPDDMAAMIGGAREIMRIAQTSGGSTTTPAPKPVYAKPVPIAALEPYANADADTVPAVVPVGKTDMIFVHDRVRARVDTRRRQYAAIDALAIGPPIKAGYDFYVRWICEAADGREYYITPYWTRVLVSDTERIGDAGRESAND